MFFSRNKKISYTLVLLQFGSIAIIFFTGEIITNALPWMIIQLLGLILGLWAIVSMKKGSLNIPPDIKDQAILITKGPYSVVRHPMYLSLILFIGPMIINDYSFLRLFVFGIMVADLFVKLNWEEKLLNERFQTFKEYRKKTKRIFPFIY
jgi:protein-S-isoprenylcysteine O-methyltransferase Ste14